MTSVGRDHECQVSALVVNFRSYDELGECLESLAGDPEFDGEVVVVDHSSDPLRLQPLRVRYPHVRFFPTAENRGFAAGVNSAARLACGRYLLLLNPDVRVIPGAVGAMRRYLDEHAAVGILGARVLDPDGRVQRSARRFPTALTALFGRTSLFTRLWPNNPISRRNLPADENTVEPLEVDWLAGSCLLVRSEVFERLGGLDEEFFLYWEDADFCRRARLAGWHNVYLPSAPVYHTVGASSRYARTAAIKAFHRSAHLYYVKHKAGRWRAVSVPLVRLMLGGRLLLMLLADSLSRPRGAQRPASEPGRSVGGADEASGETSEASRSGRTRAKAR